MEFQILYLIRSHAEFVGVIVDNEDEVRKTVEENILFKNYKYSVTTLTVPESEAETIKRVLKSIWTDYRIAVKLLTRFDKDIENYAGTKDVFNEDLLCFRKADGSCK